MRENRSAPGRDNRYGTMTPNTTHRLLESIRLAMEQSELLNTLASVHAWAEEGVSLVLGVATRRLTDEEIERLSAQGNRSADWSLVEVGPGFTTDHISGNRFLGRVVLGAFSGTPAEYDAGVALPTGLYDSTLRNCEIGDEALVHRVGLVSGALVASHATVVQTDSLCGGTETFYGCDLALPPGVEACRERLGVFAEMNSTMLAELLVQIDDEDFRVDYESLLEQYVVESTGTWTIVDEGAVVHDSGRIVASYIGRAAALRGVTIVENSCVISDEEQPTWISDAACLHGSIVQWGASITTQAIVQDSVIGEYATIEHNALIRESFVGANCHIGQGEVTASLLGPCVAAHHQSLVIATTWPTGRGNIASGAQVGSNHTGRAADQAIHCGEGLFFGLGSLVKFPADFTAAPHSVIAAGVTTLPQRVEFPFSLINTPSEVFANTSPALNEISPAWVLSHSLYQIRRNDEKHRQQHQARHDNLDFETFSTGTIRLMQVALERLEEAADQPVYSGDDITGLGKNVMSRKSLGNAVETYRFFINWYALCRLKQRLELLGVAANSPQANDCLQEHTDDVDWTLAQQILDGRADIPGMLEELRAGERTITESIKESKTRDDQRVNRIFDGSAPPTTPADDDAFVRLSRNAFDRLSQEIDALLE